MTFRRVFALLKSHHTFTVWTFCPKKEWRETLQGDLASLVVCTAKPTLKVFHRMGETWTSDSALNSGHFRGKKKDHVKIVLKHLLLLRELDSFFISLFQLYPKFSFFFFSGSYPIYIHFFRVDKFAEFTLFGKNLKSFWPVTLGVLPQL